MLYTFYINHLFYYEPYYTHRKLRMLADTRLKAYKRCATYKCRVVENAKEQRPARNFAPSSTRVGSSMWHDNTDQHPEHLTRSCSGTWQADFRTLSQLLHVDTLALWQFTLYTLINTVAYLLKARTAKPEKQPLLANGSEPTFVSRQRPRNKKRKKSVARQQILNKKIYQSRCYVMASQTNMFPWKQLNSNRGTVFSVRAEPICHY
jgi:hypothetical protein